MNGIQIEYLLGIWFLVASLTWSEGRLTADFIRLIAGIILIAAAIFSKSLIG